MSDLRSEIGNAAHSGGFKVLFFTESRKWKKQRLKKWKTTPRDNVFLARPLNLAAMSDLRSKVGNAAHSGGFKVLFFTESRKWKKQRLKKWKATPRDNVFLKISNGAPIQDD